MMLWVIADADSDDTDHFALESNGASTSSLPYLPPNFKLSDTVLRIFSAYVLINGNKVHDGMSEWRVGTFSHKIAEQIQDEKVT